MPSDDYEQLMKAIVEENPDEVQRLIVPGVDLNHRCDQGASVLFGEFLCGNLSIVSSLLENGANPNLIAAEPAATIYTEKPLELARQARFLLDWDKFSPIVNLLVQFGATDSDGQTESSEE